jgi:hypothetical protein
MPSTQVSDEDENDDEQEHSDSENGIHQVFLGFAPPGCAHLLLMILIVSR